MAWDRPKMGRVPNAGPWLPYFVISRSSFRLVLQQEALKSLYWFWQKSSQVGGCVAVCARACGCACTCGSQGGVAELELVQRAYKPQGANTHQQSLPHTYKYSLKIYIYIYFINNKRYLASAQTRCQMYSIGLGTITCPRTVHEKEHALLNT